MVEFNPTSGIPKTSYNEKSISSDYSNMTWFSTVQPNNLGHYDPKERSMNEHVNGIEEPVAPVLDVADDTVNEPVFVQDDGDYPVDPLDASEGKKVLTENFEGLD